MNSVMLSPTQQIQASLMKVKEKNQFASIFVRNSKKQAIKLSLPRQYSLKQFKQNIAKRMGTAIADQALFLHGKHIGEDRDQIDLLDGLIFHIVNLKRINTAQISFTVRRIEPHSTPYRFVVDPKLGIQQFMKTMLSLHFPEVHSYFLVYTGRQLSLQKCFRDEFIEDGCELLAVHKIQNRKTQSLAFKKEQFKKSKDSLPKSEMHKIDENLEDGFKKREKQGKISDKQKNQPSQTQRKQNNFPDEATFKQRKTDSKNNVFEVCERRQQDQQLGSVSDLYQTAKFNSVEEIKDSRLKKDKQVQTLGKQGEDGIELQETEQIIIGNYNALSYNQEKPFIAQTQRQDKSQAFNNEIPTQYGLVPKKQSSEFNRESCEISPISQSVPQIVPCNSQLEAEADHDQLIPHPIDQHKELLPQTEISPDRRSLKSSFTPSMTQMTLKTISSHYDQEMDSSTKSRRDQNLQDQNSYSQSFVYNDISSMRYSPDKQSPRNINSPQAIMYQSTKQQGEDSQTLFMKKPKSQINNFQELPLVKQQVKIEITNLSTSERKEGKEQEKSLVQTVSPIFFGSYQNEEDFNRYSIPWTERIQKVQSEQPESIKKDLNQSEIKIQMEDSAVIPVNRDEKGTGQNNSDLDNPLRKTQSLSYQQNFTTDRPDGSKNEAEESPDRKLPNSRTQFESGSQVRMSTGEQQNIKKYPHISSISEATSIYQPNLSDCPQIDQQEIMNRFPHLYQMNMRNSFTSDVEQSIFKWDSSKGNLAGNVQSEVFQLESPADQNNHSTNQETNKVNFGEDLISKTKMEDSAQEEQQKFDKENKGEEPINSSHQQYFGENDKDLLRKSQSKEEESLLLEDTAKSNKIIANQEAEREKTVDERISPPKSEQEDDNLLNYVLNSNEKFVRKKQYGFLGGLENSLTQQLNTNMCNQPLNTKNNSYNGFCFFSTGRKQKVESIKMGDLFMIANTESLRIIDNGSRAYINKDAEENIVEALRADILLEFYELQQRQQRNERFTERTEQDAQMQPNFYNLLNERKQEQQNLLLEYL